MEHSNGVGYRFQVEDASFWSRILRRGVFFCTSDSALVYVELEVNFNWDT